MNAKDTAKVRAVIEVQRAVEAAMRAAIDYIGNAQHPQAGAVRRLIRKKLAQRGCECPEGLIAVGGKASAQPHANGRGELKRNEPIVIDIFPRSKETKYFADMTRTICLGRPSKKLAQMYKAVGDAQAVALKKVRPGAACADIQRAVEKHFERRGFPQKNVRRKRRKGWLAEEGFRHSVGHGVSTKIHDRPRVAHSGDVLRVGDIITIEPGLYYKDTGGVRIEDMILVTSSGYRILTKFPKKLVY